MSNTNSSYTAPSRMEGMTPQEILDDKEQQRLKALATLNKEKRKTKQNAKFDPTISKNLPSGQNKEEAEDVITGRFMDKTHGDFFDKSLQKPYAYIPPPVEEGKQKTQKIGDDYPISDGAEFGGKKSHKKTHKKSNKKGGKKRTSKKHPKKKGGTKKRKHNKK